METIDLSQGSINGSTVNALKFLSLFTFHFLFTNKMLVIRTGVHKMLVRIANREDPGSAVFA